MMSFRFLHAADLHLDSPLRGLEADADTAALIRMASRRTLGRLVDRAIAEDVAFVLLAGDLFDGDWTDVRTGLELTNQLARLGAAGIRSYAIRGNHDAASVLSRTLRLPGMVHLFDHGRPSTEVLDDLGVAIHGRSFPDRKVPDGEFARLYPDPIPGRLNIGLLHTSAEGGHDHDTYAPCSVAELRAKAYAYWALGHVHTRAVLHPGPWVVFPGNLQGRHIRETGPKGASLVTVVDGRVVAVDAVALDDDLRWLEIAVDASGLADVDGVIGLAGEVLAQALATGGTRRLAVRVVLHGTTAAHDRLIAGNPREDVRLEARRLPDGHRLWIESVQTRTASPRRLDPDAADARARLAARIEALAAAPPENLLGAWPRDLADKLAAVLPTDHALRDPASADVLARARDLILARLGTA